MNFAIDERTKHRITGLVVIMAVAIIFVPAMLKKSNQRLEENIHLSVQLPPKPIAPKVAVTEAETVFETVKVEKMPLSVSVEPTPASQIARIENLTPKPNANPIADVAINPIDTPTKKVARKAPKADKTSASNAKPASPVFVKAEKPALFHPKPVLAQPTEAYAVQLAAFSVEQNAEKLVARLRDQGYKAQYQTVASDTGLSYKVTVGQLDDRTDARLLKQKLNKSTQLEGFIVKRDVS
ncbi:MAG: SPOR domain-containing protein [Legionellaceae bacterium]|nr:SPOR domain-containing protein [Legionellaceae bacterium]